MTPVLSAWIVAAVLSGSSATAAATDLQDVRLDLDPERVHWTYMRMEAKKFLLSATTTAELSFVHSNGIDDVLIPTDRGDPVTPGPGVAQLDSTTRFFGRESKMQLHMRPESARAIQYALDEDGDRLKHRIYRYTDTGIFVRTHRPGDADDRDGRWQDWSDLSTEWRSITEQAYGAAIVEPLGLLYVAGAVPLEPGGPPTELLSISDRKVTRVWLTPHAAAPRQVDFELETPGGSQQCKGEVAAIRLEVEGEPVAATDEASFEFLGLKDDIRIHIEPRSRVVLEVSGKAPIVGDLVIRLKSARLRTAEGCPII